MTTNAATALTARTARLNGTVSNYGSSSTVSFEYGPTTAYGSTVAATPSTVAANGSASFYADVANLACNTLYHFRAKATNASGSVYGADLTFTTGACPPFCEPPPNIPSDLGVTCVCDTFDRTAINPFTIFGGSWALSNSDNLSDPYINTGRLRLTEKTKKNAKAATAPGVFPAEGNYISVEFNHYAYNGNGGSNGADGVALTLSDYSIPAVPGAFGGSLGYAQKSKESSDCLATGGCPGFAGGWLGVGLDEYGYYTAEAEGRVGGDTKNAQSQSIGLRGPGRAQNGYRWMGGAIGVNGISASGATAAPGSMYQVIVDSRNSASGTINVSVNRDSANKDGSSYSTLIGPFNVYPEAQTAKTQGWIAKIIPDYWKVSFTGATGDYTNIHEIDSLRICAQRFYPSTSGVASGFSAIDEAYSTTTVPPAYQIFQTGDIYMKVAGQSFKLWVAALSTSTTTPPTSGPALDYSKSAAKYVQVKIVDNSDNVCGSDAKRTCTPACTGKVEVETGAATKIAVFAKGDSTGATVSPSFTLNSAHKNLIAVMRECRDATCSAFSSTTAACSTDSFSVRPLNFASVTSSNAANSASSGTPMLKAGSDSFTLAATTIAGYTGVPKINSGSVAAVAPAMVAGALSGGFLAAISGTSSLTATGTSFTYDEVGAFLLRAPDFSLATPRIPGVYDDTWTSVDSGADGDCVTGTGADAYSYSKNGDGKYGCFFGISDNTAGFGRFIPDHFVAIPSPFRPGCVAGGFSYMDQPFFENLKATIEARNFADGVTQNYQGSLALATNVVVGVQMTNAKTSVADTRLTVVKPPLVSGSYWTSGSYPFVATSFTRQANPDGSYEALDIGLSVNDADSLPINPGPYLKVRDMGDSSGSCTVDSTGLSTATGVCTATKIVSSAKMRYGRLRLDNAYGSELLDLTLPLQAQYWDGTSSSWVLNKEDSCTNLAFTSPVAKNGVARSSPFTAPANSKTPLSAANFGLDHVAGFAKDPVSSAMWTLTLTKPSPTAMGSVDLCLDLGGDPCNDSKLCIVCSATTSLAMPWLKGLWYPGTTHDNDPKAKVTFGVYHSLRKLIHRREVF